MSLEPIVEALSKGLPCDECTAKNIPPFGTLYKQIREESGIKAQYIADLLFIHPATMTRIEQNKRLPLPNELSLMIEGLRCSVKQRAELTKAYLCSWLCYQKP